MSRPVRERLVELSADVDQVRLAPAAAVRKRGRSRARRQWAGAAAALTTVVAAGGLGLTTVDRPGPGKEAAPAGSSSCRLTLPDDPSEVRIRVIGSADQAGQVTGELTERGFQATGKGWIDPDSDSRGTVAVLRYGPRSVGAAALVRALVGSDAVMKFQPHWDDPAIELVLGTRFQRLATTTEVNQNLVALGEPTAPPGC